MRCLILVLQLYKFMAKKKCVLYPSNIEYVVKSYKGVKKVTVPSQSMSLREILIRFTRKESLPVEKEGVYETRFGDLEKLKHEDIVVQREKIDEIATAVSSHNKRERDKAAKAAREKEEEEKRVAATKVPPVVPPDKPTT